MPRSDKSDRTRYGEPYGDVAENGAPKVLAGTLALLIGASAPSLIMIALNPSAFIPSLLSPSAPPIGEVPQTIKKYDADRAHNNQNNHESFWQATTDDPVAIVTLVLALATIALACVSWHAAADTRRALILAQRPRIRIRNIVIRPPHLTELFFPGNLISGQ